jgi:hypothetical protein
VTHGDGDRSQTDGREEWALPADEARVLSALLAEARRERDRLSEEVEALRAVRDHRDALLRSRSYRYLEPARRAYAALRARRAPVAAEPPPSFAEVRRRVAAEFLRGDGIEIGALNEPLALPAGTTVRYVDRMPLEGLREHYPELSDRTLVAPDVIDDGERLSSFADGSVDFIVANHFIEHCQDPIGTIDRHLQVVRVGGALYLAVPDKRRTFDVGRPVTSLEHLVADHREGPERSRREHFLEWAIAVDGADAARAVELEARDYSIHFHVWTPESFRAFVDLCRTDFGLPFEVAAFRPNDFEFLVVLRRVDQPGDGASPASASTSRTIDVTAAP